MAKSKRIFVCRECGHDSVKWQGKCPGCGAWNTMDEEIIAPKKTQTAGFERNTSAAGPMPITHVQTKEEDRLLLDNEELKGVLGGGIVPGSLILVGGEPGIGKSTLLLQVAYEVAIKYGKVLYVSGEESAHQIKMRAERLGTIHPNILLLTETNMEQVLIYAQKEAPVLMIIDSIQTAYLPEISAAPGSVTQVRQCAAEAMGFAKGSGLALVLVGHVTKEGMLAGPRVLEHMVDTVLYFEGERQNSFRILRAIKNRFGSTNEIAVFDMQHQGLVSVSNLSQLFLSQRPQGVSGSVVFSTMQGTRPVLLEVQALSASTSFGNPRRLTSGVDYNKTLIILAVLDKIVGMHLGSQDIYVNIAGGVKIDDPAADLAIAVAVASSFRDQEIDGHTVVMGEIGLNGEVRAVTNLERRLKEAVKMGFKTALIPQGNKMNQDLGLTVLPVGSVKEALDVIFTH
ncbi:DNA repair protein RadA [Dehalobacterium formicoaceticum]|uniref:DNA repair protein RadA n=1 Tax=Dehalobacterium formicoaceticum TaxID=51515 RepID=A0ABT1XZ70_9FIRM|nr:DNA repair protein RadA [Dehalobacterium formicoaceticum]MCR6543922.1 DNA repair protein RadA [Dehalobacterium formicoaceticum]